MEEIFRTIADSVEDSVLVIDSSGLVAWNNQALAKRLRWSEAELAGRRLASLVAADFQEQIVVLAKAAGRDFSLAEEIVFRTGDGDFVSLPVRFLRRGEYLYLFSNAKYDTLNQLQSKLEREIGNAVRIHRRTLPERLPVSPAISFDAHYAPAADLGGDLYGIFKVDHGLLDGFFEQYICYLTDVSGHGLDSAMLSVFVRDTIAAFFNLRYQVGQVVSPKEIVDFFADEYLREGFPEDFFVAIFLGLFDLRHREFLYCSAGFQQPPLVAVPGGAVQKLRVGGLPISSALPAHLMAVSEHRLELQAGMNLLLSTDGLVEQRAGEQIYGPRLEPLFAARREAAPAELLATIRQDFAEFTAVSQPTDDITLVAVRIEQLQDKR